MTTPKSAEHTSPPSSATPSSPCATPNPDHEPDCLATQPKSVWVPLRYPRFRVLWIAITLSNIGTWMNEIGLTWMMSAVAPSNLMVALIQTATTLPFFLFAYPAGAMGDVFNRRTVLLIMHLWMLISATLLTLFTAHELTTATWLLVFTFALATGNAMMRPSWTANIPSFVPPVQLSNAITLNSLSTNISKALGPIIGGALLTLSGPAIVFALNALSFLVMIYVLVFRYPSRDKHRATPGSQGLSSALKAGFLHLWQHPAIIHLLIRCATTFVFISAFWAMMPVILLREMNASAQSYGLLIGATGLGAIIGANLIPGLVHRGSRNRLFTGASAAFALCLLAMAHSRSYGLLALCAVLGGLCWLMLFSSMVVTVQSTAPRQAMARMLSLIMLVYGISAAGGSAWWGYLSDLYSIETSITVAALGLILSLGLAQRFPLAPDQRHQDLPTPGQ